MPHFFLRVPVSQQAQSRRCRRATVAVCPHPARTRGGSGPDASSQIPAPSAVGCRRAPVLRAAGTESSSQRARLLPGT